MIKELLVLADLTGKSADELEKLIAEEGEDGNSKLKPDAFNLLYQSISEATKEKASKVGKDQHGRGMKETSKRYKEALKSIYEDLGADVDLEDPTAAAAALNERIGILKKSRTELTEEEVTKHPSFGDALAKRAAELQASATNAKQRAEAAELALEAAEAKFQEQLNSIMQEQETQSALLSTLKGLNATFGTAKDPAKAIKAFLSVSEYKFVSDGKGGVQAIDKKTGEQAKNKYGQTEDAVELLKENWMFGFEQEKSVETPGVPQKGKPASLLLPSNKDAAMQAIQNEKNPETKKAMSAEYKTRFLS